MCFIYYNLQRIAQHESRLAGTDASAGAVARVGATQMASGAPNGH